MPEVITNNLDLWTSALLTKSAAGRGSNGKLEAYGIKKLRELILELAVRGKLVPQNPDDEPASVLLERIEKEKARLVKEENLGTQKPLPEVAKDDKHFGLPNGWNWTRLGEVTNYGVTDKAEPEDVNEDTWVLDLEDVEKETSRLLTKNRFAEKPFRSSKNRFSNGDVIYGKLRPYLDKVLVADEDGVCTTEMVPVRGFGGIYPFYLRLVMKTPHFIKYADDSTHGMNLPRLGTDKARMALFPLAPIAEQYRIVAKVDELMALCDQLEQQQADSLAAHQTLVETLLGTLPRIESQQEFSPAWVRIASHFDTLFTTEASIDQLKQTILQLAVMGKLVPQDPNDEPASDLLKRIQAEKTKLIAEDKIKKEKPLPPTTKEEQPFELPEGWMWVQFGALVDFKTGNLDSNAGVEGGKYPFFTCAKEPLAINEYAFDCEAVLLAGNNASGNFNVKHYKGKFNAYQRTYVITTEIGDRQALSYGYLNYVLVYLLQVFQERSIGTLTKYLTLGILKPVVLALPPLAEQHRIVAKVDELMALCDALKANLSEAQTTQIYLADAIVEQAVC